MQDFFTRAEVKILAPSPSTAADEIADALKAGADFRVIIANAALPGLAELAGPILDRLQPGGFFFVEDLTEALRPRLLALTSGRAELKFYDSMDYKRPDYGADALAVIKKPPPSNR